jgi:hypothetical protein
MPGEIVLKQESSAEGAPQVKPTGADADIVEFEQGGKARADYGTALLSNLSRDLTLRHGKGFSRSTVIRVRQFYLAYPIGATLSHQLSWSHVVELST